MSECLSVWFIIWVWLFNASRGNQRHRFSTDQDVHETSQHWGQTSPVYQVRHMCFSDLCPVLSFLTLCITFHQSAFFRNETMCPHVMMLLDECLMRFSAAWISLITQKHHQVLDSNHLLPFASIFIIFNDCICYKTAKPLISGDDKDNNDDLW